MARADNAYSRLVNWLKVLLPLTALAILSTLFLLSRKIDPTQAIPFATVDVDALIREPRINAPNYSGVTEDGTALRLTAESARPDPMNLARVSAVVLHARFDTPDGVHTEITADAGSIDGSAGLLVLQGGVSVVSSLGYRVSTDRITAAIDRTRLETDGAVTAAGPFGTLAAGQMLLTQASDGSGSYVLVFKGGVKLLYDPKS